MFSVHLTPSAGIAEPVRGLPFCLLRKSYTEIEKEADEAVPKPDLNTFIDALTVSKELKNWMKKHHTAQLTGQDFIQSLTPDDIINVKEFWNAYFKLNAPNKNFGFPVPKFKESDAKTDPEKYQKELDEYHAKVKRYILLHPESKDGMDSSLDSIDPSAKWNAKQEARGPAIKRLVMDFTQSKYFVAQTQTDINGNAGFTGVPPGNYWITSLSVEAQVDDVNARWDVPATIHAGAETRVALSNYNAAAPAKPTP
ncbi:MAG TPA: hypothetical protein VGR81_07985 [Candidatus Acidoferrales bacterium]|nr:hypothetical protein [Candidatus Acidoferrales bacterium]